MTNPHHVVIGLLGCVVSLSLVDESHTQYLAGADRESVVAGIVNQCMRGDRTDFIPRSFVERYCQCFASGLADRIPTNDIKTHNSPITRSIIQEESKRCHEAMKAEAKRALGR